jgi:eukaryotic-like serine/threonine-protein kinase
MPESPLLSATLTAPPTSLWRVAFTHADAIAEMDPNARDNALAALRRQDPALARIVASLLASPDEHTVGGEWSRAISGAVDSAALRIGFTLSPGTKLGNYTLSREIGQGGMSSVWLAERTDGALKRPVAIKLPLAFLPLHLLADRFVRKRQMLAQLDHPHIARIYDTGTSSEGQPYLVLEYIDGKPLGAYCDAHALDLSARVRLIANAARAVAHAHSRLILHRDLKPSNILVTEQGDLKLLDFGIAKLLTDLPEAEDDQLTRLTGIAVTPQYAAPEQLLGDPVSTATDVFALGVVMFQLLTGALPFDTPPKDIGSRIKALNRACISLPDAALSEAMLGHYGFKSLRAWRHALHGDLAAIAERALRLDANARYPSALAFAEDLERYLSRQPVLARDGAWAYRARKFVQRQRVPVSVGVLGAVAALGLGAHAWQQSRLAQLSHAQAQSVDGLMKSLFKGMSPDNANSRTFTAKELLDRANGFLSTDSVMSAEGAGEVKLRVADLYKEIGAYNDARALFAKERVRAQRSGDARGELLALWNMADASSKSDDPTAAKEALSIANALATQHLRKPDELLARLANSAGDQAMHDGRNDDAIRFYRDAETQLRAAKSADIEQLAWSLEGQGDIARMNKDLTTARDKFRQIHALDQGALGRGVIDQHRLAIQLAQLENWNGRFARTVELLLPVRDDLIARVGATHDRTRAAQSNLAYAYVRQGQWPEALVAINALRASDTNTESMWRLSAEQLAAQLRMYQGAPADGEAALRNLIRVLQRDHPSAADSRLRVQRMLGESLLRQGNVMQAAALLRAVEREQLSLFGASHVDTATTRVVLGYAEVKAGQIDTARPLLLSARDDLMKQPGAHHPFALAAMAYAALIAPTPEADRAALASRIERELGWQAGAADLAQALRTNSPPAWGTLPLVL